MKQRAALSLAMLLLLTSAGCASRTDWIESTLVTVDITGVWKGWAGSLPLTLVLEQRGPKVTGTMTTGARENPSLDGSVEGDVFRFEQRFGTIMGEATVSISGDEMTGELRGTFPGFHVDRLPLFVRRAEAHTPTHQEKP